MFEAVVLDDPIAGDRESLLAAIEGRIVAMSSLCGSTRAAGARRSSQVAASRGRKPERHPQ